ncbi:MAG: hypothetical protein DRP11_00565 [Candidatus Aenigmatarchaeota archaeon]|nr:MAG: hypothetical protein DRP11_00565 [Candidatus Aenigmarchaeota archaeon]
MSTRGLILPEKLREKFGKRLEEVLAWKWDRIRNYAFERRDDGVTISAEVEGNTGVYSCLISENELFCSCKGQTVHKTVCKHLLFLCLYAYFTLDVDEDEMYRLLRIER